MIVVFGHEGHRFESFRHQGASLFDSLLLSAAA